jgi:hypothetical protein
MTNAYWRRGAASAIVAMLGSAALADTAAVADRDLVMRARAALGEVQAFERLNAEIVKRCHEPVTGAYGDWREEFHADLERVRALDQVLQRRASGTRVDAAADERLQSFTEVEGQVLYSRCLRWSTLLIQRESALRAGLSAKFNYLRENEARLRAVIGNDAAWQEWRAAGTLP